MKTSSAAPSERVELDDAPDTLSFAQSAFALRTDLAEIHQLTKHGILPTVQLGGETRCITEGVRELHRVKRWKWWQPGKTVCGATITRKPR